jgi:hypothetical protein
MFKAGPDVFVNLPFVHACAQLIPLSCTEDKCASSLTCKNVAPVFIFISTEAALFMLASVTFVMGVRAPKTVNVVGRDNLESGCNFYKCNIKGVPSNGVEDQRRPFFFFREVVGECRTVDGVGNVIWESRHDFLSLNNNRYLLLQEMKAIRAWFHLWRKKGLCFCGKRIR